MPVALTGIYAGGLNLDLSGVRSILFGMNRPNIPQGLDETFPLVSHRRQSISPAGWPGLSGRGGFVCRAGDGRGIVALTAIYVAPHKLDFSPGIPFGAGFD